MKILFILDYSTFGESFLEVAARHFAKSDMIWFRIKNIDTKIIYEKSTALKSLIDKKNKETNSNVKLALSERADVAHALSFDSVHLGANSVPPSVIKKTFPDLSINYSAHSLDDLKIADVDFFTLSPIISSKYPAVNPLGADILTKNNIKQNNVLALGGVKLDMNEELMQKGFAGIAGIRIFD